MSTEIRLLNKNLEKEVFEHLEIAEFPMFIEKMDGNKLLKSLKEYLRENPKSRLRFLECEMSAEFKSGDEFKFIELHDNEGSKYIFTEYLIDRLDDRNLAEFPSLCEKNEYGEVSSKYIKDDKLLDAISKDAEKLDIDLVILEIVENL